MRSTLGALSRVLPRHVASAPSPLAAPSGLRAPAPHPVRRQAGLFSSQRAQQTTAASLPGSNVALAEDAYRKLEGTKASAPRRLTPLEGWAGDFSLAAFGALWLSLALAAAAVKYSP